MIQRGNVQQGGMYYVPHAFYPLRFLEQWIQKFESFWSHNIL